MGGSLRSQGLVSGQKTRNEAEIWQSGTYRKSPGIPDQFCSIQGMHEKRGLWEGPKQKPKQFQFPYKAETSLQMDLLLVNPQPVLSLHHVFAKQACEKGNTLALKLVFTPVAKHRNHLTWLPNPYFKGNKMDVENNCWLLQIQEWQSSQTPPLHLRGHLKAPASHSAVCDALAHCTGQK